MSTTLWGNVYASCFVCSASLTHMSMEKVRETGSYLNFYFCFVLRFLHGSQSELHESVKGKSPSWHHFSLIEQPPAIPWREFGACLRLNGVMYMLRDSRCIVIWVFYRRRTGCGIGMHGRKTVFHFVD